ncbi:MAG: hypothetical protein JO205_08890 [Pseudolabrys sp.]|nr:hypothetical protein [Pseudolabrys sp.]
MTIKLPVFLALALAATPAFAQSDNKACAQQRATVGSGNQVTIEEKDNKNADLSEKLAKSDGVLCPPENIDPEMKAPTPEGGKMPIIPPPGTPQNQPDLRPK